MDYQVTMPFKGISAADRRRYPPEPAGGGRLCDRRGRRRRRARCRPRSARSPGSRSATSTRASCPLAELQSAVVDHAIAATTARVDPFRPAGPGGPPQAWLEAFVGALVDDECLARVLLAETHGGALSPFRHQIIDVAVAAMAPPESDPQADLRARLVAYAQIGTLSEFVPRVAPGAAGDGACGTGRRAGRSVRPPRQRRRNGRPADRCSASVERRPARSQALTGTPHSPGTRARRGRGTRRRKS